MVLWQGLTEGGTAVPVQVTEEGKVVAQGQQGEKGEKGDKGDKGDTGDTGPAGEDGEYGPGDNVELNNAYFTGNVSIGTELATGTLSVARSLSPAVGQEYIQTWDHPTGSRFGIRGSGSYFDFSLDRNWSNVWSTALTIDRPTGNVGISTDDPSERLHVAGTGLFTSDVVVGSRNKQWMLVESGGLCHMVDQAGYLTTSTYTDEGGSETTTTHLKQPVNYPVLRDIQAELTMVEQQLQKVMERLKMVPEAGWEVWDGSD